jgi:hypothetical protein
MKNTIKNLFAQISGSRLESLTREVKETIAFGYIQGTTRVFTSADLWNIQRQGKIRQQRRFL